MWGALRVEKWLGEEVGVRREEEGRWGKDERKEKGRSASRPVRKGRRNEGEDEDGNALLLDLADSLGKMS